MKRIIVLLLALACASGCAFAQTIYLKNKQVVNATSIERNGSVLNAVQAVAGGSTSTSYPISTVERVFFPNPPELRNAVDLIGQGKNEDALRMADVVAVKQSALKDIPGNLWSQAAFLKIAALSNLGRDRDAGVLLTELEASPADPDVIRSARMKYAGVLARKDNPKKAVEVYDAVVKDAQNPQILSEAWVGKGYAHLALRQYEDALRAYMRIPIFYAEYKPLVPAATLGIARSYVGFEEFDKGIAAYKELLAQYKNTPEAKAAESELKKAETGRKEAQKRKAEKPENEG